MTTTEFREHPEYKKCMELIKNYRPGFRFTINYANIRKVSRAKMNGMRMLLQDAAEKGLIKSVAMSYSLDDLASGELTEETFIRTEVQ